MSTLTTYICPVSRARVTLPGDDDDSPINTPEFVEIDDDDDRLPPEWGSLVLQRVVKNPDYAEVIAKREALLAAFDADVAAKVEGVDEAQRPLLIQGLDQTDPVPPEYVYERVEYSTLSPEAYAVAFNAIRAAFGAETSG